MAKLKLSRAEEILSNGFEVMARKCDQCLMTENRIVSPRRAAAILAKCKASNSHFICHKSPPGREIACAGHHETGHGQISRIAERLRIVVRVDPETLQRTNQGGTSNEN